MSSVAAATIDSQPGYEQVEDLAVLLRLQRPWRHLPMNLAYPEMVVELVEGDGVTEWREGDLGLDAAAAVEKGLLLPPHHQVRGGALHGERCIGRLVASIHVPSWTTETLESSNELALALDLLDDAGEYLPPYREHFGPLLFIREVVLAPRWRRLGLVSNLLQEAMAHTVTGAAGMVALLPGPLRADGGFDQIPALDPDPSQVLDRAADLRAYWRRRGFVPWKQSDGLMVCPGQVWLDQRSDAD